MTKKNFKISKISNNLGINSESDLWDFNFKKKWFYAGSKLINFLENFLFVKELKEISKNLMLSK